MTDGSLADAPFDVDDRFVGDGYSIPTRSRSRRLNVRGRGPVSRSDPTAKEWPDIAPRLLKLGHGAFLAYQAVRGRGC
jgi:hypothetical protein